MSTAIQNDRNALNEQERANREREALQAEQNANQKASLEEQKRSNKAREKETERSNRKDEALRTKQLDIQRKTAIGQGVGSALGGVTTAALLFNDIDWYLKNPKQASSIMSLPTSDTLGTSYPLGVSAFRDGIADEEPDPEDQKVYTGPSILTMILAPTIGKTRGSNSPVMRAANEAWTVINETNGRNSSYEAADVTMYQLGLSSLAGFIGFCEKVYDWLSVYSGEDSSLPKGMVESFGCNYTDFLRHRYDLHAMIEDLRAFANSYRFLPQFKIANRWYFINKVTLADPEDNSHVQWYAYAPAGFYKVDVLSKSTRLKLLPWAKADMFTAPHMFNDLVTIAEELKSSFFRPQDIKIMNSDITAYINKNKMSSQMFPTTEYPFRSAPSVSKDYNALAQFRNADGYNSDFSEDLFDDFMISQETEIIDSETGATASFIRSNPPAVYYYRSGVWDADEWDGRLIELYPKHMDAEAIIEATRLIPWVKGTVYEDDPDGDYTLENSFFSEVPVGLVMTKMAPVVTGTGYEYDVQHFDVNMNHDMTLSWGSFYNEFEMRRNIPTLEAMFAFKYCPLKKIRVHSPSIGNPNFQRVFTSCTWEDFTYLPYSRLHTANNRIALRMLGGNQ